MTATARQMVRSPFSCSLESCRFSLGACTMEARQHPKHAVTRVTIFSSSPQGPSGVIFNLFSYHTFAPWSNFVGLWLCWAALPGALSSEVTWSMSPSAGLGNPWRAQVWCGGCASPRQAATLAVGQVVAQKGSCQVSCRALGLGSGKALGRGCFGTSSWGQQLVKHLLSNRNSHFILLEKEHFPSCFRFLLLPGSQVSVSHKLL